MCVFRIATAALQRTPAGIENAMRAERMQLMTGTAIGTGDEQGEMLPAAVRDRFTAPLEGEKRLMLAVLQRAVDDFRTYANIPTGRGQWLFREVSTWFESPETGPFDFEGICQATGLDPDFIRMGLRGKAGAPLPQPHDASHGYGSRSSSLPTASAVPATGD